MLLPSHYTFPQAQLQRALEKRFPYEQRLMEIFTVQLSQPRLSLLPGNNRLRIEADMQIRTVLGKSYRGQLAVQSGVRYEASQRALVLSQPELERFDLADLPKISSLVSSLGHSVVEPLLRDYPVHKFQPDELQIAGITLSPSTIDVLPDGIRVGLAR